MTLSEEIIEAAKPYIDDPKEYHGFIMGADWAIDRYAPKWISVKDEMPEVGVVVLTTTAHGTQRVGIYDGGWWLANHYDLVRMGSITHWMPLPQVPKGGEE